MSSKPSYSELSERVEFLEQELSQRKKKEKQRPRDDKQEVIFQALCVGNDITAEKTAEKKLVEQTMELERAKTALQQHEATYRALFDEAPICLWESDCSIVIHLL